MHVLFTNSIKGSNRNIYVPGTKQNKISPFIRLVIFLSVFCSFQISYAGYGQSVSINKIEASLKNVIEDLSKQSGYTFLYDQKYLYKAKPVTINVKNLDVEEAIKMIFKDQPFAYQIIDQIITLKFKPETGPPGTENMLKPQDINKKVEVSISGIVLDANTKQAVPGATVKVKGMQKGASTDERGTFRLTNLDDKDILVITFIGYVPCEIEVSKLNNIALRATANIGGIDITKNDTNSFIFYLIPSETTLGETVITAYGRKQIKEAVTGSVTTVKPGNLKIPSSNLTNALAGQAAGVIAYQPNGQPGFDNSQFFIRGATTFGYNRNPLILIDNIESSINEMARLQIDDIEAFSILKDAGATAMYGSRGANGVLLIATKRGKEGPANINLRYENSISSPTRTIKLADPITYMKNYNEALTTRNLLNAPLYNANKIYNTQQTLDKAPGSNPYVYPAVDWLETVFKNNTLNQRANLSVSGGGKIAAYYVSGSYNLDNGILKVNPLNNFNNNIKLQNYQFRTNVDVNVTKTTKLSMLLNGIFDQYNGPISEGATDLYSLVMHTNPVSFPAYYEPDTANNFTKHVLFGSDFPASGGTALAVNPYAQLLRGYSQRTGSTMNAQVNLRQDLNFVTEGLSANLMFSTSRTSSYSAVRQYNPFYYRVKEYAPVANVYSLQWLNNAQGAATEFLNFQSRPTSVSSQVFLQGNLNYDRAFGKNNISIGFIGSRQERLVSSTADQANALIASLPFRNVSMSGRLGYTYDRRYTIEGSFGYNGSERFASENQFGFFPVIAASWVPSNEKFWTGGIRSVISRLKFRVSHGITGNDNISGARFFYVSGVNIGSGLPARFGIDGTNSRGGVTITNYPNPNITFETSRQTNLGTELTLFNSLNVTIDAYKQDRFDIYQDRLAIASSGLEAAVAANLGKVNSKGLEVQMDYAKSFTNGFSMSGRFNLTATQSKITFFEEPDYLGQLWRRTTGTYTNQAFGYIAERFFVDDLEARNSPSQLFVAGADFPKGGDIKYKDINNDGVINAVDRVPIGYPTSPQITYGFGVSASYKKFDVNAFLQGNAKVSFFIDANAVSPFVNETQLLKSFADDHWTQENQNLYAKYPRLGTTPGQISNNVQQSTWWMRDGSFLRVKSIEFGYTLPENILTKLRISNCRIYCSGLNLFSFSSFKDWDMEQGSNAFAYPIQKVFNMALTVTFK